MERHHQLWTGIHSHYFIPRHPAGGIEIPFAARFGLQPRQLQAGAEVTVARIETVGAQVIQFDGDLAKPEFCEEVIPGTLRAFGRIDILVNSAGEQRRVRGVEDMAPGRVKEIFCTNMFACLYLTKAALPHLKEGGTIINTAPRRSL